MKSPTIYTTFTPHRRGTGDIVRMSTHAMDEAPEACFGRQPRFPARAIYLEPVGGLPEDTTYYRWAQSCLGRDASEQKEFRGVDSALRWVVE